ncbi:MFS transporter [Kitasatospora sp. NPDC057904]|uniref:MFS transporter n=1 Tax=Kitasatospora sp. NPDC057904 TaxID=3346275 RepID=UPI0036DADFDE
MSAIASPTVDEGRTRPDRGRPALTGVQRRAVAANAGIILLSSATGGMSADLLQLFALQVLCLSPGQIGLALGLLVLSNPVQLWATRLAERIGKRRTMQAGALGMVAVLALFAALAPLTRASPAWGYAAFALAVLGAEICIASSWGVAWNPWVRDFTTSADRAFFVSRMKLGSQLVSASGVVAVTLLLGGRLTETEFDVLLAGLAGYLVFAARQFQHLPERRSPVPRGSAPKGGGVWATLRVPGLRKVYLVGTCQMLIGLPLLTVYAVDVLHYPAAVLTTAVGVRTLANLWCLGRWGRLVDRLGPRTVMRRAGLALAVLLCGWVLVPSYNGLATSVLLVVFSSLVQVAKSGFSIAFNSHLYTQIPEEQSVPAFTLLDVLSSSTLQLYGALAGCLMPLAWSGGPLPGWLPLDGYKAAVAAGGIVALCLVAPLFRAARRAPSSEATPR